jgi:DNA polymerase
MGVKNGAWLRVGTHPGKLVENIIQAMARDILVYGLMCAEQAGYRIIMSVHDEGIAESKNGTIEEFCKHMCLKQTWARTLPLRAEGYTSKRYRKE